MRLYKYIYVSIFAISIMTTSCYSASMKQTMRDYQCEFWIKNYFGKPNKDYVRQFQNYDIESQYAIYICGNQIVHPPAIYLAKAFAMEGKEVVDFLSAKLINAKDDLTIRDIILVFRYMHWLKTYDVLGDKHLVDHIIESSERVQDEEWKRIVKNDVYEIMYEPALP
jgi:hypothetical protein